ncbi:MAG: alkaline phosphatase family protein [Alphaproteobacteria bacterium]|nr:alkaline phosphatase family protein [Alphaproteobacteria bacterium]MBU2380744.1 alkaline phosphatase family protein [Alphaproteobacteria bacterium]
MSRLPSRLVLALVTCMTASAAMAQTPDDVSAPATVQGPSLVVTIVIDQLSSNLFNQYRDSFTGGLHTLASNGLVYANGFQQHAMTETCPGHSTVLTGMNPASSGIPANDWIDRATGEEVYCLAAPENTLAHGRNTDNGPVGPGNLRTTTLGDWLKARTPESRVFAVSGKDRGAINLAGHHGDGVFWMTEGFGFTTYVEPDQTAAAKLAPVAALNARINARFEASPPTWTYTRAACRALEGDWTIGDQTFHATLPPATGFKLDTSPVLDELTLEAATELLDSEALGRRGVTDVLGVSLSATDRIGHTFGTQGPEMCEQMHRLDVALGSFLDHLSQLPGGVVVVLTADHGGSDFPERMHERGYDDAMRADPAMMRRINTTLKDRFGLAVAPLSYGGSGLMVVGPDNIELADPRRDEIAAAAVEMLRAEPVVVGAWTIEDVLASPLPSPGHSPQELSLLQRHRLSAVAGRSPDIVLALQPNTTTVAGRVGGTLSTHGTPWDYDRGVPIVFWSPGMTGQERFFPARTIDIAPTLANVVGVEMPEAVEGRCMDLGLFDAPACRPVDKAPTATGVVPESRSALRRVVGGLARRLGGS